MAFALRGMRALRRGWIGAGRGSCAIGHDAWVLPWMLHLHSGRVAWCLRCRFEAQLRWPRAARVAALAAGCVREVLALCRIELSDRVIWCLWCRFGSTLAAGLVRRMLASGRIGHRLLCVGLGEHVVWAAGRARASLVVVTRASRVGGLGLTGGDQGCCRVDIPFIWCGALEA